MEGWEEVIIIFWVIGVIALGGEHDKDSNDEEGDEG